jgi:hypothetical protein
VLSKSAYDQLTSTFTSVGRVVLQNMKEKAEQVRPAAAAATAVVAAATAAAAIATAAAATPAFAAACHYRTAAASLLSHAALPHDGPSSRSPSAACRMPMLHMGVTLVLTPLHHLSLLLLGLMLLEL